MNLFAGLIPENDLVDWVEFDGQRRTHLKEMLKTPTHCSVNLFPGDKMQRGLMPKKNNGEVEKKRKE